MGQYNSTITKIIMDSNYNVGFYNQYDILVVELDHAMEVNIFGTYLICNDANNSVKFFVNTISLISGPTFSQAYTPLNVGFYQQDSAYFSRLNEIKTYIQDNVVKVLFRGIDALIFSNGTVQTTAATGGGGSGTVTSVGFVEGTGIDITGTNPITTSGSVTITNTAPDQVVTMTDGTGIDVTGTYPNFTITNTSPDQTVVLTDGTAINVTGTYPNFTINNTAPDQTVVLSNGTGISTSGTYPNFTITNTAPDQTVVLNEGSGIDITGTYPNFTIASTISGGVPHGTATGTDTYAVSISGVTSYTDGDAYLIRFTNGNTTSSTLNINSLGAKDLYRNNDGSLIGGDIVDGAEMLCVYNSTTNRFQVIGTSPNMLLAYVTNSESISITKGQPVYAFGGVGDRLKVKLAYNTSDATSAQTVGLVLSSSIAANQKGLIILNGQLDGLNILPTSTWADGDPVYLGATAGTITNVKPHAPNHLVYLGFVTTASNGSAGRMYVRVQNGYELDELHDVDAHNPNNNDGIFFNSSNSLWEHKSIATVLGYTPGTVTSIATTSPILGGTITSSGTISIQQADTSKDGYLSYTDWNTFNNKQNAIIGAATTITSTNLTANRAVISNGSGKVAVSTVTDTELGYISGVTSAVQTQLNSKQDTITLTTTGTSGSATLVGSTLNIPQYSALGILAGVYGGSALTAGQTTIGTFENIGGVALGSENLRKIPIPTSCNLSKFYTITNTTQPSSGSLTLTIRKNNADTALVITIAANSVAGTYSNTTNSIAFAAGDAVTVKFVNNAGTTSASIISLSVLLS